MSREGNEDVRDRRVSDTYRQLARETAPEALNRRILRQAAKTASAANRRRGWLRPLAFAATVVLSATVVLQIVKQPAQHSEMPRAVDDVFPAEDADVLEEAEKAARLRDGPAEADNADDRPSPATAVEKKALPQHTDADAVVLDEVVVHAARARAGDDTKQRCDEQTRDDPDAWAQCIEALRSQGLDDEADHETSAFNQAYPQRPLNTTRGEQ